jgi:hypothetical protein
VPGEQEHSSSKNKAVSQMNPNTQNGDFIETDVYIWLHFGKLQGPLPWIKLRGLYIQENSGTLTRGTKYEILIFQKSALPVGCILFVRYSVATNDLLSNNRLCL